MDVIVILFSLFGVFILGILFDVWMVERIEAEKTTKKPKANIKENFIPVEESPKTGNGGLLVHIVHAIHDYYTQRHN